MTRTAASPSSIPQTRIVQAERRRAAGALAAVAVLVWALGGLPAAAFEGGRLSAALQPPAAAGQGEAPAARPGGEGAAAGTPAAHDGHAAGEAPGAEGAQGEGEHTESPWAMVARLFNFALLAGGLVYVLRSPLMAYLEQRGVHVRSELARAADLRAEAAVQVDRIDAKMKALPAEIETLKRRGAEEITAEEARIRALAEVERKRLLDQAKRGIETELRVAERDLKKRAGELAIAVATERVKRAIDDRDQARLVDRYVAQVKK